MNKKSIFKSSKFSAGFTLIELLVAIAIIGVLSSVVVVSVNAAREKSTAAFIQSSLKNIYNQAEITYTETGKYNSLKGSYGNCVGPVENIAQAMTDKGIYVKCNFFYHPFYGLYGQDFVATALIYDTNELKAWSVDKNGVTKWYTKNIDQSGAETDFNVTMQWQDSNGILVASNACAVTGGRVPSLEHFTSLAEAWYQASGAYSIVGLSYPDTYWTTTPAPAFPGTQFQSNGYGGGTSLFSSIHRVRCIK